MVSPPDGGTVSETLCAFDARHLCIRDADRDVSRLARHVDDEAAAECDRRISLEDRIRPTGGVFASQRHSAGRHEYAGHGHDLHPKSG